MRAVPRNADTTNAPKIRTSPGWKTSPLLIVRPVIRIGALQHQAKDLGGNDHYRAREKAEGRVKAEDRLDLELRLQHDAKFGQHREHEKHQESASEPLDVAGIVEPVRTHAHGLATIWRARHGTSGAMNKATVPAAVNVIAMTIGNGASPCEWRSSSAAGARKKARWTIGRK